MQTVSATLNIEIEFICPHCDEYIDLMKIDGLNDEGELINEACPSGDSWTDSHEKFERKINCPDCKKEIHVQGIEW